MSIRQLTIFDFLEQAPQTSLNDRIADITKCDDISILNACAKSIKNFQVLSKDQTYVLAYSGGKDSHLLLAIYNLYLKLGNEPLNLTVRFADTELEHPSLYETIYITQDYCDRHQIPFEIVKGKKNYWEIQFRGYPVPNFKSGSLRLGCFHCPVISLSTIGNNFDIGLIDREGYNVRLLLEELRNCRRINNERTKKSGAIYIYDRRLIWEKLNKDYLLEKNYITQADIISISQSLQSDYYYPVTYRKEWIDLEHKRLNYE